MRKIAFAFAVSLVLMFSFAGCGSDSGAHKEKQEQGTEKVEQSQEEAADEQSIAEVGREELKGMTYILPDCFTVCSGSGDEFIWDENYYKDNKTGAELSITVEKGDTYTQWEPNARSYFDLGNIFTSYGVGAEGFSVGSFKGATYHYEEKGKIIECDFYLTDGERFYSGALWSASNDEEPEALTDKDINAFNELIKTISIK